MKDIKTREELKEALRKPKTVVMFGKPDCLHCTIVKNCIESVERHFPLINFYYTEVKEFADARNIDAYPVTYLYENGNVIATLVGSKHITKIRDILNLWFLKD
jgi:thioredoxin-like negative regulator of GroEL